MAVSRIINGVWIDVDFTGTRLINGVWVTGQPVAVGGATPKGVFGLPLHGPFAGAIYTLLLLPFIGAVF